MGRWALRNNTNTEERARWQRLEKMVSIWNYHFHQSVNSITGTQNHQLVQIIACRPVFLASSVPPGTECSLRSHTGRREMMEIG